MIRLLPHQLSVITANSVPTPRLTTTALPPPLVVTLVLTDNLPIGAGVVTVAKVGEGARDVVVVELLFGTLVALVSFMPLPLPPP